MAADQAQQAALTVALLEALKRAWPMLDVDALRRTMPGWQQTLTAIITQLSAASATLAARTYTTEREAAGITTPVRTVLAPSPPRTQIEASLDYATKGLWSRTLTTEDIRNVEASVEGVAQELVADTGRATVRDTITRDREAVGYVRIARPSCCAFCRMLAARGAVYATAETAGEVKAKKLYGPDAQGVANRFHPNCHCVVRPIFSRDAILPEHNQQWAEEWQEVTAGLSGNAARIAWRQFVEGRQPT